MKFPLCRPWAALLLFFTCTAPGARGQTIEEALDTPALTWNSPAGTLVQNDVTFDGVDAVQLSRSAGTPLSVTVIGPARMELQVRTSTEENADYFEAAAGGFVQARISGGQPWQKVVLEVPPGSQRVDLLYRKDAMTAHGADAVWVDAVKVLPAAALSIAGAVEANFPGEPTVSTAMATWFTLRTPDLSAEDGDVLVLQPSPVTATNAAVQLQLPVIGRGRLSLSLRYEGTGTPAGVTPKWPLRFEHSSSPPLQTGRYVSLEFIQPLDAPVPAAEVVIPVPANLTALVDSVRWTPLPAAGLSEALDTEPLPWLSFGGVLSTTTVDSFDGEDAVLFYDVGAGVALPVTGPAQVTWLVRNGINFTVDGFTRNGTAMASLPGGWTRHEYLVPPGARTLRWQNTGTASIAFDQHARLDSVTMTLLTTVDIPEATDAPNLNWSTAPDTQLTGIAGDSGAVQDGDAVRLKATAPSLDDWLEAAGAGTGRLHFAWGGAMTCAINGADALSGPILSNSSALTYGVVELPAGEWAARWRTAFSSTLFPGLDAVSVVAGENETLSSLTDCTGGVRAVAARARYSTGPVTDWQGAPGRQLLMDGSPALTVETPGSGTLRLRVWAPAGTTYAWNVSQQSGGGQRSGAGGWQDLDIPVTSTSASGIHRLTLTIFSGAAFAVDRIEWSTGSLLHAAEALETPGVTWTHTHTGGTAGWLGRAVTAADNAGDATAMLVPSLSGPASADLSATLTGGGWLTFTHKVASGVTFEVLTNGARIFSSTNTSGYWRREYVELSGAGPHSITFRAGRASGTSSSETAVGSVALLPWAVVDEGAAAEVPAAVTLRCAPQRPWRRSTSNASGQSRTCLEAAPAAVPAVLEAEISGPGWLTFEAVGARVLHNGAQVQTLDSTNWQTVLLTLPPGVQKVRVTAGSDSAGGVDNFSLLSATAQTLGEALDQPDWTWTADGPWNVSVPSMLAHDGADAVVFGGSAGITGTLRAPHPGGGLLSFSWMRPTYRAPRLSFVAGSQTRMMDDSYTWRREFVELTSGGGAELVWSGGNGEPLSLLAHALLDGVRFSSYHSLSFAEALDTPGRAWTTGTPAWRTLDDGPPGPTADYAAAPPVTGLCYLETAVTHPVWVEFDTLPAAYQQPGLEPAPLGNPSAPPPPSQDGVAPGWVRRRVITGATGPGTLRFSGNNPSNARLLDRVFISEAVSAAEALDSTLPWQATFLNGEGAGFRLNGPLVDGDAFVIQARAFNGHLSTTLTGPGEFSLRYLWEWENPPASGVLPGEVRLGGVLLHSLSPAASWQEIRYRVPAGEHELSLRAFHQGTGMLLLDDFRFTAEGTDEVAQALDLPGSYGSTGSGWSLHPDAAAAGGSALRAPENAPGAASLTFIGSGSLEFAYQFTATEGAALSLLLDGEPFWSAPPAAVRTTVALPVPRPGEHQLTLRWQPGADGASAWMDALTLTPFLGAGVQEALDTPGRTWDLLNGDGVFGTAASTVNADALRLTAPQATRDFASLTTDVTGPVRVSFRWYRCAARTASGFSPPTLTFRIPNLGTIGSAKVQQWEEVQVDVPPGTVTLQWQLSVPFGSTPVSALLDDVRITPVTLPATLGAALDLNPGVTVNGNGAVWRAVTAPSVNGEDALIGIDFTAPLNFSFSGIGEFEYTCSLPANGSPGINVSGAYPQVVETVWRQPGALYNLDLVRFRVPFHLTGARTVSLYSSGSSGLSLLDEVTWRPRAAPSLAEALDTPERTWTTSGTPPWQPLPFPPNRMTSTAGDVAWIASGAAATSLETTVIGAHAVTVSVLGGTGGSPATLKALVNGTLAGDIWTMEGLGTETLYMLLPAVQILRLLPAGGSSDGLSVDSVTFVPNPSPPAWLAGPGVTVEFGQGVWRSFPAGGELPARTLSAYSVSGSASSLTVRVEGAGALEYFAKGGSVRANGAAPLGHAGSWMRHRLELPDSGPHALAFSFSFGGLADLRWLPGPASFGQACGLTGPALFAPVDLMAVLPGGGLRADATASRPGLIATASSGPALFTWWQQSAEADDVTSTGTNGFNLFRNSTPAEAGPAPAPALGLTWLPQSYFTTADSLTWQLAGSVSVGKIRRLAQSVPLAEALDLPAAVTAAEFAPGSAFGYPLTSASGGDVVGLRAGEERALVLTATGPGILTCYTSDAGALRVTVGNLPPVDVFRGFNHVLLSPGPQTVVLGNQPGFTGVTLVDDVRLLPLPFDPVTALGEAQPLVITSGAEPGTWPLVIDGDGAMQLTGTESLSSAVAGPARVSFHSTRGAVTGLTNYIATPAQLEQQWPAGQQSLWLDRGATVRIFGGYSGLQTRVEDIQVDAALPSSFSQALDAPGLSFAASAGVLAHSLPKGAVHDGDAAAFAIGSATRTLQTQVTGPGRLRFWWRTLTPQANAITCRIGGGTAVSQETSIWKQADLAVPAGPQTVIWTVAANMASAELDEVQFFPQWTFAAWAAQNALAAVPAAVRALDDSDNDGVPGLLEYAFGLDPAAEDAVVFAGSTTGPDGARGLPLHRVARALDGQDYLELQFPRRLNSGLTYQMQIAGDLAAAWENVGVLEVLRPLGADWELCRIRDPLPVHAAGPRRFARLHVIQP